MCLWRAGRGGACAWDSPPSQPPPHLWNQSQTLAGIAKHVATQPTTSTRVGSISHDRVKKGFNLEWEDLDYFNAW
jgi:hypothetical protein